MSDRAFDLVLQGSTGFTGRLAAEELAAQAPEGLRWAVAGRDRARVEAVAERHGVPALVADGLDAGAVGKLAASTRVVLSCAGPFARYGTPLAQACAAHGTHYADLTGEVPWVAALIRDLHGTARGSGAALVPAAGFDSVPSDVGVAELREACPDAQRVYGFFRLKGGLNGGTLATGLDLAERGDADAPRDPAGPRTFAVPALGRWAAPFPLDAMNEATVRRSAELRGAPLEYTEHALVRDRMRAWTTSASLGALDALIHTRPGRALLRRLGPKPGEGPSEKARAEGFVEFTALAGDLAAPERVLRWHWPGDPANVVTTRCLVQTGLALAAGEARGAGVLTPVAALGARLGERLRERGAYSETRSPAYSSTSS